jgi:hypothetical protein
MKFPYITSVISNRYSNMNTCTKQAMDATAKVELQALKLKPESCKYHSWMASQLGDLKATMDVIRHEHQLLTGSVAPS